MPSSGIVSFLPSPLHHMKAFESAQKKESDKIPISELVSFCLINPESKSWLEFYNDAAELDLLTHELIEAEVDYHQEAQVRGLILACFPPHFSSPLFQRETLCESPITAAPRRTGPCTDMDGVGMSGAGAERVPGGLHRGRPLPRAPARQQ